MLKTAAITIQRWYRRTRQGDDLSLRNNLQVSRGRDVWQPRHKHQRLRSDDQYTQLQKDQFSQDFKSKIDEDIQHIDEFIQDLQNT